MGTDNSDRRRSPSNWLRKWFRDEEFWRDVTAHALAALIVAVLGYLYAIFAGYLGDPNMWRAWISFLAVIGFAVMVIAYVRFSVKLWRNATSSTSLGRGLVILAAPLFLTLMLALTAGVLLLLEAAWG